MRALQIVATIIWKDILLEWRSKQILSSVFIFSLLTIVVFNFALGQNTAIIQEISPGVLWVTIIFAGILGLNRSFSQEKEEKCLQGLLLSSVDGGYIYFGKMLGNFLFITLVEMIIIPIFMVFFNHNIVQFLPGVLLVLILGTFGLAAVGTIFAALSINTKAGDVILPVLLFPVLIPLLIGVVKSTRQVLQDISLVQLTEWINLLMVFDIVLCAVSFLVFEHILEE